jgi:hypothetical protein
MEMIPASQRSARIRDLLPKISVQIFCVSQLSASITKFLR